MYIKSKNPLNCSISISKCDPTGALIEGDNCKAPLVIYPPSVKKYGTLGTLDNGLRVKRCHGNTKQKK